MTLMQLPCPLKVFVFSNGCPENRIDVARAEEYMLENLFCVVNNWQEADIILFNACGLSNYTTENSLRIINEIQTNKREGQQLIVWGCLPKIDLPTLKAQFNGLISPGSELSELSKLFNLPTSINKTVANNLGNYWFFHEKNGSFPSQLSQIYKKPAQQWMRYLDWQFNLVPNKDPNIFYIKISSGCQGCCTYCAVRNSRGLTKSKTVEEVLAEFNLGLQKGFKNFVLLGTDLGSYGVDIGSNLVELLRVLVGLKGDFQISLRNVNPYFLKSMLTEFCLILKSSKIRYLEVPAESGSNRILKLMNRRYTIEEYKDIIDTLRLACPDIIIRTQVITGFPTETKEEFEESMKLLDDVFFDYVEVYEFSPRRGTIAEKIVPKVGDSIKKKRTRRLCRKALLNRTPRKIEKILINKI